MRPLMGWSGEKPPKLAVWCLSKTQSQCCNNLWEFLEKSKGDQNFSLELNPEEKLVKLFQGSFLLQSFYIWSLFSIFTCISYLWISIIQASFLFQFHLAKHRLLGTLWRPRPLVILVPIDGCRSLPTMPAPDMMAPDMPAPDMMAAGDVSAPAISWHSLYWHQIICRHHGWPSWLSQSLE